MNSSVLSYRPWLATVEKARQPVGRGHESALRYRPDIDGLRAVAVILVIAFHAGITTFRNGFLGVDVFFVISGYLISGIIFEGLEREDFSFRDFYVRRANRILPALITVVVATAVAGWLFMYDYELVALGKHVIASSTFVSNFVLWRQTGYFDLPLKPLLHLWSLGVEEQFYLLWPTAAVFIWGFWRKSLSWILAGIITASFALGMVQIATGDAGAAFYLPLGRFWEILSGALLQHVMRTNVPPGENSVVARGWVVELTAIGGLVAMVVSMYMRIPDGTWPGYRALLPVFGTVLLMASGGSFINRRLLSFTPLVKIGLISYPLYLWHWTILVFAQLIFEGYIPPAITSLAIATSFLLSVLTFRFIEIPIRFGHRKRRSALLLVCSLPLLSLLGLAMVAGVAGTRVSGTAAQLRKWGPDWLAPPDATVNKGKGILIFSLPGDTSRTVFLYGDSHMNQYWPRVLALASKSNAKFPTVSIVAYGGCSPLPGVNRRGVDWALKPWECDRIYRAVMDHARTPRVKTLVISAWWEVHSGGMISFPVSDTSSVALSPGDPRLEKVFNQFELDLASLVALGKHVYLVLPSPVPGSQFPRSRFPRRLTSRGPGHSLPGLSRSLYMHQTAWVSARLRRVAAESGATVIDPSELLCSGSVCPTVTADGMPIYRDGDHLRAGWVAKYATYLDQAFR